MSSATVPVSSLLPALARTVTSPAPQSFALAHPSQSALGPPVMTPALATAPVRTIALEDIVRCMLRRWKAGLAAAGITGAIVFLLLTSRVPQYQAEASLVMRMRDNKVFNFDPVTDNSGEATTAPFLLNNHRIQLKSRQFLEFFWSKLPVADRAAFIAGPEKLPLVPRLTSSVRGLLPQQPVQGTKAERDLGTFVGLCDKAGVDFIKETLMVKVSLRHHNADVAARIANAWVAAYMDYIGREETSSARQASEFLKIEVEQQRSLVSAAEQKYADYCREHGLVGDEEQKAGDSEKLKLLHSEQAKFEVELDRAKAALRQVQDAGRDLEKLLSVDALSQDAALAALRAQLTEKRKSWQQVDATYGPKHPVFINAANEFKALSSEITQAVQRGISGLQNRAARLTKEVETVHGRIAEATGQAASMSKNNGQKHMLKSQLESERSLYEKILGRLNEATVSSRFHETTHLRQAETAVAADDPVSPSKPLGLMLGGLTGVLMLVAVPLLLAALALLRREGIAGLLAKLRHAHPAAAFSGAVLPAALPQLALPSSAAPQMQRLTAPAAEPAQVTRTVSRPAPGNPVAPSAPPQKPVLQLGVVPQAPSQLRGRPDQMLASVFSEAHPARAILESAAAVITDSAPGLAPVILVTSQEQEQGKSFIACGLGVAGLAAGRSAVVIDCNVTRPSLGRWLPRLFPGMTLRDMAAAGCIPGDLDAWRCGSSQLFTIQAGASDSMLDGIFCQPWFARLISWLRTQVGVVIIDGPALPDLHELRMLASFSTRAVLVTRPEDADTRIANAAQFIAGMAPELERIATIRNTAPRAVA